MGPTTLLTDSPGEMKETADANETKPRAVTNDTEIVIIILNYRRSLSIHYVNINNLSAWLFYSASLCSDVIPISMRVLLKIM